MPLAANDEVNPSLCNFHATVITKIHQHYIKAMLYEATLNKACQHFKFSITNNTDIANMGNC
jgi:hypothetical protein